MSVLLGDGRGGFTSGPGSPFPTGGATANSVAVGDFDRSGTLDLATANGNSNDVGVLLGDGRGRFATAAGTNTYGSVENTTIGYACLEARAHWGGEHGQ